jgi:hypothetical protein
MMLAMQSPVAVNLEEQRGANNGSWVDAAFHTRKLRDRGDFPGRNAAFKCEALFRWTGGPSLSSEEDFAMQWTDDGKWRAWLVDYSAARSRAIEWLGDRYLLAKPINRRADAGPAAGQPGVRTRRASGFLG